jgi:RNA-splicing ligase RtcB
LPNPWNIPVGICASADVPIEASAVDEILTARLDHERRRGELRQHHRQWGGGNHFAELQYVTEVHDRQAAHAWGFRPGQVVLMVHSGSLSLGHQANASGVDQARAAWPGELPVPDNGIIPMLLDERSETARHRYLDAFGNAANFAVGNRFFLSHLRAGTRRRRLGR